MLVRGWGRKCAIVRFGVASGGRRWCGRRGSAWSSGGTSSVGGDEAEEGSGEDRMDQKSCQTRSMGKKTKTTTKWKKKGTWRTFDEEKFGILVKTHGLALGRRIASYARVLVGGYVKDERILGPLRAIGVPVENWREYVWKTATMPALEAFKELYGNLSVRTSFVVPYGDCRWPRATWGYPLGRKVSKIRSTRQKLTHNEELDLVSLGFIWNYRTTHWEKVILPAFETFHRLYGHVNVPQEFVVPSESIWPQATWELKLGNVSQNIRHSGSFKEQRQEDAERWNKLQFRMTKSEKDE